MANSYTQFVTNLHKLTKEEKDWAKQELEEPDGFEYWPVSQQMAWSKAHKNAEPENWPDFQHAWEEAGPDLWTLVLFFEENGNLDYVCNFVQTFLQKFRPKDCHRLEWAFTCSKMREGEFGGGAAFITAEKQEWIATSTWLREQEAAWEKAHAGG